MLFDCLSAPCCLVIRGIEDGDSYQLTRDSLIANNKDSLGTNDRNHRYEQSVTSLSLIGSKIICVV